ncbi:hypothetical protein ACJRO7_013747 [Eucalyptus globulus]|uniref:Uncharacterized protein n=1 Tax=Eucalyptus globulus TaxID=34317 RepID=A0ABD3KXS5_EUCGL
MLKWGHGDGNGGAKLSHAGPPGTSSAGAEDCFHPQLEEWNYFVPTVLPNWPAPPLPDNGSCCHVLREIIHTHEAFDYSSNRVETFLDELVCVRSSATVERCRQVL